MKVVRLLLFVFVVLVLSLGLVRSVQAQGPVWPTPSPNDSPSVSPAPGSQPQVGQATLSRKDFCNKFGKDYDPQRCLTVFEYLSEAVQSTWVSFWSGLQFAIVRFLWGILVFSVGVANFVTSSGLFVRFYDIVVGSIESIFPTILLSTVFSKNGLFVLIYSFGALLMIIPIVTIEGMPKAEESIGWGVLLLVFFVTGAVGAPQSGSQGRPIGFYILDQLDTFRREVNRLSYGDNNNPQTNPVSLLAQDVFMTNKPLIVTLDRVQKKDFDIPPAYIQKHFQQPDTEEVTVQFIVGMNATLERKENSQQRAKALEGVFWDVVTALFVALTVLSVSAGLAALNIMPMIFVVLFFVALPTIFFSVGRKLLMSLVNAYFATIILSIMFGVFLRFLVGFNAALRMDMSGIGGVGKGAVLLFFNFLFFIVVYSLTRFSLSILRGQIDAFPQNIATAFAAVPYSTVGKMERLMKDDNFLNEDFPSGEAAKSSTYIKTVSIMPRISSVYLPAEEKIRDTADSLKNAVGNAFKNRGVRR